MLRIRTAVAITATAALLTGCAPQVKASYPEHEATEAAVEAPAGNCLTISEGALTKLASKLAETVPGAEVKRTGLVASTDSDLSILAVEFTDPGTDREFTGIWGSQQDLTTEEDPAFVAIDDVAAASAEYLQPKDFAGGIGAQLPSAGEAVDCLA